MFETDQGRRSEVGVGGVVCMTRPWQGSTLRVLGYTPRCNLLNTPR